MSAQSIGDSPAELELAAARLISGGLVAFPTETVYGLGADAGNSAAIQLMYAAKNRPADHPVIIHVASEQQLAHWVTSIPDYAHLLMAKFWPGPMTLILPRSESARDFVTGSQDSVGIRIPGNQTALRLLSIFHELGGKGVAAPSANRYGAVSPTTAQAVQQELGQYLGSEDLVVDGGECGVGVESTIIDCTGTKPVILRPGAITSEQVQACTGLTLASKSEVSPKVSGSHKKHYSPKAKVLVDGESLPGEGLIALATIPTPVGVNRLATPTDHEAFARVLYAALRAGDEQGLAVVRVVAPEGAGLAVALRDRINRAASSN